MSPVFNGSTAIQRIERGNTVEIRNGIMFQFLPGTATYGGFLRYVLHTHRVGDIAYLVVVIAQLMHRKTMQLVALGKVSERIHLGLRNER